MDATKLLNVDGLIQETGLTQLEIGEYWLYHKSRLKQEAFVKKYIEEAWKALTVSVIMIFNVWVMQQQPVFWSPAVSFTRWPQLVNPLLVQMYKIALGYHLHRALFQFGETKRSDFYAMMLHHWVKRVLR